MANVQLMTPELVKLSATGVKSVIYGYYVFIVTVQILGRDS